MKTRLLLVILALSMVIMTACGASSDTTSEATEQADDAVVEAETTVAEEPQDNIPYAEAQDFTFSKLAPLSLDYSIVFVDNDHNEISDSDHTIIDKGTADYTFYDVKSYPAEQDGYTTTVVSYIIEMAPLVHGQYDDEIGNYFTWTNLVFFDYYTGTYIPTRIIKDEVIQPETTQLKYNDKAWQINAYYDENFVYDTDKIILTDENHYDVRYHALTTVKVYMTYPNDYDGLSFCINGKGAGDYNKEGYFKRNADDYKGFNEDVIGKDIISANEEASKDDLIFYTLKDSNSISPIQVASIEDTATPSYEEILGLKYSDSLDDIGVSYNFFLFNEDGELAGEDMATVETEPMKISFGSVKTEELESGETLVTIPYGMKYNVHINAFNLFGEFSGQDSYNWLQAFDLNTGEEYTIDGEVQDNSDWGEWEDDENITWHNDTSQDAEITIPTDRLEDVCFLIGDRYGEAGTDYVAFKLDTALTHTPEEKKASNNDNVQPVEDYAETYELNTDTNIHFSTAN